MPNREWRARIDTGAHELTRAALIDATVCGGRGADFLPQASGLRGSPLSFTPAAQARECGLVALKPPAGVMLFRRRLTYWDKVLPTSAFARVGRSYIVQLAAIEQIDWSSRNETVATFGEGVEPLALGRLPGTRLREILGGNA